MSRTAKRREAGGRVVTVSVMPGAGKQKKPAPEVPAPAMLASCSQTLYFEYYDLVSMRAWHLGQVTMIFPLPRGTESIVPQLGHLRKAFVLRSFHIFFAVRA